MRLITTIVLLVFLSLAVVAQRKPRGATPDSSQSEKQKIFPYEYTIDDLPNGLRLVTIPTDFPNIVAVYTVVRAGARNEVEHGKSGYAHLFEHLMFRGSEHYTPEQRDAILKRAGADDNAYTTDDRTVFHEVFSKEDLDTILQLNADTFERLKYSPDAYKTETKAVLGEFNKNSSNPTEKLFEVLRATAYRKHTYEHTAMGFIKDIEDMPNQYDYSLQFYQRYYRPENVIIMVVGDVQHAQTLAMVKKYFGDWKRGNYTPQIPSEPEQASPREEHIDWPSPTLPYVDVAFRGPAYSDTDIDHAALDLLQAYAFGENSDLYQKLVLKEQKVESLETSFADRMDPELFYVESRVKEDKDLDYVRDQVLTTYKRFTTELIPQDKLDATRSRLRYSFALSLDSSAAIAGTLASYVGLRGTPESVNKVYALYDRVTPEDVRAAAARYFVDRNRTIVTLTSKVKGGGE